MDLLSHHVIHHDQLAPVGIETTVDVQTKTCFFSHINHLVFLVCCPDEGHNILVMLLLMVYSNSENSSKRFCNEVTINEHALKYTTALISP